MAAKLNLPRVIVVSSYYSNGELCSVKNSFPTMSLCYVVLKIDPSTMM